MTSEQGWKSRDWVAMAVAATIVVLVAGLIAGAFAIFGDNTTAAAVSLERAGQPGADPFTASAAGSVSAFPDAVGTVIAAARRSLPADPKTHTLVATGSTPGLYGGSGDAAVCNPALVVSFLQRNPQEAAAWAGVLGISTREIAAYVGNLTPVWLMSDTLVTNHGYNDGRATNVQSVLQAGTAVMVDATGTPRVKCNCGNPLTPPEAIAPTRTAGPAWPGYSPTQVTVVKPGTAATIISVVNVVSGAVYKQPVGSGASTGGNRGAVGEFVATAIGDAGYQGKFSTSADASSWTVAAQTKQPIGGGLAWNNGNWLVLSAVGGRTSVLESTDLQTWRVIAIVPAYLADLAHGGGQWIAVGGEADSSIGHGVVYTSPNGATWTRTQATDLGPELDSVAYGNGVWIAVDNGHQGGDASTTYRSTDGSHWTRQSDAGLAHQGGSHLAYGSGQWVLGGLVADPYTTSTPNGVVSVSPDGITWTTVPSGQFAENPITGLAYGNNKWVLVTQNGDVFSSPDATTWTKQSSLHGGAFDLSFGGTSVSGNPAPPSPTETAPTITAPIASPAPTAVPAASLASIDWKNFTYEDEACPTRGPITLTNGTWYEPGTKGQFSECSMPFVGPTYVPASDLPKR